VVLVLRLGLAGENGLERQLPKPRDGRGMGVVAAREKSETGILHVGNKAVAHQVPAAPEPDRREIELRIIEARGEVVDDIGQAIGLVAGVAGAGGHTEGGRGVVARATSKSALGGLYQ